MFDTFMQGRSMGPNQEYLSNSPLIVFRTYSLPLSVLGWTAAAITLGLFQVREGRYSQARRLFIRKGFNTDIYKLMIRMRGGGSRLTLLQHLDSPKHRFELSEITGIDWKEVDRQLGVLEKHMLIKMYAQSGTVRLYEMTEQGRLLLKVIDELNNSRERTVL